MATRARSYFDLPFDELYDAESVMLLLTSGISDGTNAPEHPDELAFFEGRLISFRKNGSSDHEPLEVHLPIHLITYRRWVSDLPGFENTPTKNLGTVAFRISHFEEGKDYYCRAAVLDEAESNTSMLLLALMLAGLAGERGVKVELSGRRDQQPDGGLVARYAWEELGIKADEFGQALDAREHEAPLAQFEQMAFDVNVDTVAIAKRLNPK